MSEQDTYEYYRIAKDIVTRPHSLEDLAEGQIYATWQSLTLLLVSPPKFADLISN